MCQGRHDERGIAATPSVSSVPANPVPRPKSGEQKAWVQAWGKMDIKEARTAPGVNAGRKLHSACYLLSDDATIISLCPDARYVSFWLVGSTASSRM